MATKVGEGYLEIKPRLVGFNRDLLRDARRQVRELEARSKEAFAAVAVKPKIGGITKAWQREIQQQLNATITGLTVDVKVKLENDALKATFNGFTVEAKRAGREAADAVDDAVDGLVDNIRRDMRETEIAIKRGLKPFSDPEVTGSIKNTAAAIDSLASDTETLSDRQVTSLRSVVNEHHRLNETVSKGTKVAVTEYEREIERAIRATDRMVEKLSNQRVLADTKGAWDLARSLDAEIKEAEKIADSLFPDLQQRVAAHGQKTGQSFTGAFTKAFRANLFDNLSEGLLTLGARFAVAAVSAQPFLTALANLSSGMVFAATVAVDLYGAFLALPAVWAAVAQATTVLSFAFQGVGEALNALQNEEQHAAANSAVRARQIEAAQEQVAAAKERLARVIESTNASITRAEEAVADAMANAAKRVASAQEALSDAQESAARAAEDAAKRVADAQKDLSRAYESAAERIASAEARHADSIRRVRDAQEDLNQAYSDALERFEDLNIALGNAVLDEEAARIAIERAKERLDETIADPKASDLDKREADLAYREALQRLQEISERQQDLQKEVDEANRTGVEGSREVTSAKERLLEAQRDEIEAQKAIAEAHKDAAEQIEAAQERVAEAQADAVRSQLDGMKRIQDAEAALAEARAEGARDIQRAQDDLAQAQKDAARSVVDAQKDIQRAIDNLADTQSKQNEQWFNARYAMSLLSPEAQKFVQYLNDSFIPKLREVQFSIQDAFFPPIQRALEQSGGLVDLFQQKLTVTAGIFGNLIGQTIEWLNTPETQNQLGRILDTNNELFKLLGEAGQNFGDVLLDVAEAAGPFLKEMGQLVVDFSQWLSDITNSKEGREELKTFFENVADTIKDVYDFAKLVGGALYEIYQLARPYAQDILDDIKDIAQRFSDWVNSPQGKTEIIDFLDNGKKFLDELLLLIEDVAKAFFEFGRDGSMAGVVKSLREDLLPAVLNLIKAFGGDGEGSGFIFFIKAATVAANLFAGNIALVSAAVGAVIGVFTGDWEWAQRSFNTFLNSVSSNIQTVFGGILPENFDKSTRAFNDSVTGMSRSGDDLSGKFGDLQTNTQDWSNLTETTTTLTETNFNDMANNVGGTLGTYRDDVDQKTRDAKDRALSNTDVQTREMAAKLDQMRLDSEAQMERYRSAVDTKTRDAKDASNRNVGDIVRDAGTLLLPFSGVFLEAGKQAQDAIRQPGADWYSVGSAIINGLWQGVKDLIPNLITSIWNLGVDIVNTIRSALDSRSPSRKMMAVGRDTGEGLALGIEAMQARVGRATKKLGKTVVDSFGNQVLDVELGATGPKVVPTVAASGVGNVGAGRVTNVTVYAAPTVPTEKQISNILKYQDALYE